MKSKANMNDDNIHIKNQQQSENHNEYVIDSKVFIVTPYFNTNTGKSIYDVLLDLMKNEVANPCK